MIQTKCALQPVPFKPSKLTVQRFPGTRQTGLCPQHPRRYTLTHNDLTGQLLLTIGHHYNKAQLSGWYNRLLRDEILAYWQFGSDKPVLHIECHVSGEETWLAPPILRDYIFRREMPLVLNVINFAEAPLLADNPAMADAQVMVHLASHVQAYHATVLWGRLSDCSSWQPPPRWARTRLVAPNGSAVLPNLAGTSGTPAVLRDHYWYNAKTGTTRWDHPHPEHTTDDGHHYYQDPESGTTTWTKPAALAWVPMNSEEHAREYYYNTITQESVWEKPESMAWQKIPMTNSEL
ncbi:hypothetical protein WJX82_007768 [Trebouxia sp. C0006]